MDVLKALSAIAGIVLVSGVLASAMKTVVLPREGFTRIARIVFALWHRLLVHDTRDRRRSESRRALFSPVALLSLPVVWMITVIVGFSLIFWGFGIGSFTDATATSGSSVTTLGFAKPNGRGLEWLAFLEAIIGLGLVALLISYLPTLYGAYNQREKGVEMLLPLAGQPPTSTGLLTRLHAANALSGTDIWVNVSNWLLDTEQSHTSFPALCWFPTQRIGQSWVAAAGAVLDAAALITSGRQGGPWHPNQRPGRGTLSNEGPSLVLAYGAPGLTRIGRASGLPLSPPTSFLDLTQSATSEAPDISVSRAEYDEMIDQLEEAGVLHDVDRDRGWSLFAAIRSGYDLSLRGLAGITGATPARWTTDRPAQVGRPRLIGRRPVKVDWELEGR